MSEPPDKPEKASGTSSTDRTDNSPSVRSVAVGAVSLVAVGAGIVAFAVGGWVAVAVAGVATVGGGVVAARVRNPRPRRTRPGLLHGLVTRPRRTKSGGGSLPWPLTGSQSRRARKTTTSGGTSGRKGTGRRGGMHLPQLPALTKKGRAKRAAAHLAQGSHGRKAVAPRASGRPGARAGAGAGTGARKGRASVTGRPGGKGPGMRAPRTASRTPARAGSARKLAAAPSGRGRKTGAGGAVRGVTGPGGVGTARRSSSRAKGSQGMRGRRPGRTGLGKGTGSTRPGVRPSTAARPVRRNHRATGKTGKLGGFRTTTRPSSSRRRGAAPRVRRHPVTGGGTWPRTTGNRKTTRARKIGNPSKGKPNGPTTSTLSRRDHRRPGPAVPNRHPHARKPFKPAPTRKLVKTAMRVPTRSGWKLKRPTKTQQRRARRHLNKRARVVAARGIKTTAKSPFLLAMASYRHRPLWVWPTAPKPVNPDLFAFITEDVKLKPQRDPRPKRPDTVPVPPSDPPTIKHRHRTPYPKTHARRAPAGTQPTTTTSGGTATMTANSLGDTFAAIANYTPQTPEELEQFLRSNAETVIAMGNAFRTLGERMTSEMPIAQPVAAATQELGAALAACEGLAGQIHSTYQAAHQVEKDRRENPRPNEGFWDVGNR